MRLQTVEFESEHSSGALCRSGVVAEIDEDTCLALPDWAIRSGPRSTIYFEPEKVGCGLLPAAVVSIALEVVQQKLSKS